MNHIRSIVASIADQLPDLANILLGLVGILMSFPKLAEYIERQSRLRLTVAVVCMSVGLGALLVSGHQRQQFNMDMKNLLINTKTSVDRTEDLTTKTNIIVNQSNLHLTKLNDSISTMTGGNGFCYAELVGISDRGGILFIVSQGRYPLYDVQVKAFDERIEGEGKGRWDKQIGNVSTHLETEFGSIPFGIPGDKQSFNLFISARNGSWTQFMRLHKVNGVWATATMVISSRDERFPNGAIMLYKVDKTFPSQELMEDSDWRIAVKLPKVF